MAVLLRTDEKNPERNPVCSLWNHEGEGPSTWFPGLCMLLLSRFSHVRLCGTLWTVAFQAPLSMGFSRQEYWSSLCRGPAPAGSRGTLRMNGVGEKKRERERERPDQDMQQSLAVALFIIVAFIP